MLLDTRIQDNDAIVLVHPMHNLATIEIKAADLLQFLRSNGIEIKFIDCKGKNECVLPLPCLQLGIVFLYSRFLINARASYLPILHICCITPFPLTLSCVVLCDT